VHNLLDHPTGFTLQFIIHRYFHSKEFPVRHAGRLARERALRGRMAVTLIKPDYASPDQPNRDERAC